MANPVNDPDSRYYVPVERRRELSEHENITLNDQRAVIRGYNNDFATVSQLPNGLSAEFAWTTVERVIKHSDGRFRA